MILTPEHFFSPSEINTGYGCPFNWKCGKERLPQIYVETKFADFGHVVHLSIKEYYSVVSPNPHKGLIEGTIQTILERNLKASGLKRMGTRMNKCLKNFVRFEHMRLKNWKQYKPTHVEEKKQARINGINYRTIADAYWKEDATIVDWKSGRMNRIGPMEMTQGQVMKMVWEANGFPVKRVIFVCLFIGLELQMPESTIGLVENKVRSMYEYVRLGYFPKKKGYLCSFCSYQLRCQLEEKGICLWM